MHAGQSHYLESWDDGSTWDGKAIVPVQPLIALFDTISDLELLLSLSGSDTKSHDYVKSLHDSRNSNTSFKSFLRLGIDKITPRIILKYTL